MKKDPFWWKNVSVYQRRKGRWRERGKEDCGREILRGEQLHDKKYRGERKNLKERALMSGEGLGGGTKSISHQQRRGGDPLPPQQGKEL